MSGETWFDRLSAPSTRRQTLKAAAAGVAGAAAAALPFAGPVARARAAGPKDCKKGCLYRANRIYSSRVTECAVSYSLEGIIEAPIFFGATPLLLPIANLVYQHRTRRCIDNARVEWLPEFQPCYYDYCPGFDPKRGPYAPCECTEGYYCNPCEAVETGYICCVYPQGDCHGDCCTAGSGC